MKFETKTLVAALGLAIASGTATAGVTWHFPLTTFQDDNLDFAFLDQGTIGQLDVGDVLVSVFEFSNTFGLTTGPNDFGTDELTGITAVQATAAVDLDGNGTNESLAFGAYSSGLDSVLALGGIGPLPGGLGAMGGPAMAAVYLDNDPDLEVIGASCPDFNTCISLAANGVLFQVDGRDNPNDPDPDEYFYAQGANGLSYALVAAGNPADPFTLVDFGLSTYYRGPGHPFTTETVSCSALSIASGQCVGGNSLVDMTGNGNVLGGAGLTNGAFGRSDFDAQKAPTIPEPGSIALLAAGLLGGLGARKRWRQA